MNRGRTALYAAAAVTVAATLGVGVAVARAPIPTNVALDGAHCELDHCFYAGIIESPQQGCRAGRIVKVFDTVDGSYHLFDTARSSKHGAWAAQGTIHDGPIKFVTPKKKLGGKTCAKDTSPLE